MGKCVLLVLLMSFSGWVRAEPIKPCLSCHADGKTGAAPALDGQNEPYLVNQLTRFREHVRESFPMDALAQGLDDRVVADLARAFAARPWFNFEGRVDADRVAAGAALAQRHDCAACHGPQFRGAGDIPRLAGQHPDYLARQIEGFAAAERFHPPTGAGGRMYVFSAEDAATLAAWLAAQR